MIPCIQFGGDTEVRSEPVPRDPETLDPFGPQNHPITEVREMDTVTLFGGFDGSFEYFDAQQAKHSLDNDTHKLTLPMQGGEPVTGTFTNADGVSITVERADRGGEVMSDTKFTPGPWEVCELENWCCVDETHSGSTVAEMCALRGEIGLADAHLIAAAPELYEALMDILELEETTSPFGGEMQADRIERTIDKARAVLAKARGES